jgi:dihydrofolate reductase
MGKLIVTEFVTVDGVGQAPGGPDEDRSGDFAYGGWQAPYVNADGGGNLIFAQASTMDALLLGRRTYEIFAAYWPTAPEEFDFTHLMNRTPKYVASRTLSAPLAWEGASLLEGDLADAVTALKERHQEVHVIGSLDLVQSLLRLGLVDRLQMWVYPWCSARASACSTPGRCPRRCAWSIRWSSRRARSNSTSRPPASPGSGTWATRRKRPHDRPDPSRPVLGGDARDCRHRHHAGPQPSDGDEPLISVRNLHAASGRLALRGLRARWCWDVATIRPGRQTGSTGKP